jgi:PAS domain S-box-containing protein
MVMGAALAKAQFTLNNIPEAYLCFDSKFRCTFANDAALELLVLSRSQVIGTTLWSVCGITTHASENKQIRRVMAERRIATFEHDDSSTHRHYSITAMPDLASDGILVRVLCDIKRPATKLRKLRQSEQLYHQVFDVVSDALVLFDTDSGQILAVNASAMNLYGYSRKELLAMNRLNLSAEPDASSQAVLLKAPFIPLRWHKKKDGGAFPVEISGHYFDLKGRSVGVAAIRDITERRAMEESLRHSQEKFSKAFHSNPAAVVISDLTDVSCLDVNETFESITGYRRDEVVGRKWAELGVWADSDERKKALRQLLGTGKVRNFECSFYKRSGATGVALLSAELIEIEGHRCSIAAAIDITERYELEKQLRQAQKLEGLGRLAGGIAHDFNNLLTIINGYSDALLTKLPGEDPAYCPLQEIRKAGNRAASLTKQLLTFSRKQMSEPRMLDLNTVVTDSERMLRRLIGEDIQFATSLDPQLGHIMADPDQMHQVIMNLAVNARDAMPDGGKLDIYTKNVEVGQSVADEHLGAVAGRYVLLTVVDTGTGMDEGTLQKIFDPFFTTKEQGKGTGLGLATVYGIVQQCRGWIEVSSELGHGASFSIYLPRLDGTATSEREEVSSPCEGLHASGTVLVVEDEEGVRKLTRSILESYGFYVLEAADATEAVRIGERCGSDIKLLVTDVILPGMNGKTMAEGLQRLIPQLKVIFTSGYPADVISSRGVLDRGTGYLQKPFSPESLARKIREILTPSPKSH